MDDAVIYFGSAVKALDDGGRVGGYLVEFSDYEKKVGTPPDLVREFFTKSTDYDIEDGTKSTVYYDHGLDPTLKHRKLGRGSLKLDDVGVWIEAQLELRDRFEKSIFELAKKGKLGWSSGTAAHLVEKKNRGDAIEIMRWPLGLDASLTPKPCNPSETNRAIPLKSYTPEFSITELLDAGTVALKGWDSEGDYHRYRIKEPDEFEEGSFRTITIKKDSPVIKAVIGKLKGESSTTLQNVMFPKEGWSLVEAKAWVKEHPDMKKSIDGPHDGVRLQEHSESVLATVEELIERSQATAQSVKSWLERMQSKSELDMEVKAGRTLSGLNRDRLKRQHDQLVEAHDRLHSVADDILDLYTMTDPERPKSVDPAVISGLAAEFEYTQMLIDTARCKE